MIIKDKELGEFTVLLEDDGTMDTVISVEHRLTEKTEYRYDTEYAAMFRDENGAMTDDGFKELAEESVDAYIEDHCC